MGFSGIVFALCMLKDNVPPKVAWVMSMIPIIAGFILFMIFV